MGMVFQSYALFPHLDVFGNVVFGLQMSRVPKKEAAKRVSAVLERVHLAGYEKRRIRELSGGQQQRVALARALVTEPTVLLLDEPLSNLDANLRENMRDEIRNIQREIGITTLFVTHDQVEALTMSDRVVVLNKGKIEQVGTPEEVYEQPASRFVAEFIGRANFLPAKVEFTAGGQSGLTLSQGSTISIPRQLPPGKRVTLMIRPHRIRTGMSDESDVVRGRVTNVVYLGDLIQYEVSVGDAQLLVELSSTNTHTSRLAVGDEAFLRISPDDVLVYDHDNDLQGSEK
jgi:ABC-type Fe3+/spermidine/putrescine transport system ATPase subunit